MKTVSARKTALEVLVRCRRDGAWSGESLDRELRRTQLDKRDAALAGAIVMGVLENRTLLDFYLSAFCDTPLSRLEPKLLDILRIGACQLLLLDKIPESAAVNESVKLCKEEGLARASGLCNAVLRRLAAKRSELPEIPGKGTGEYLSIRCSCSRWLAERLIKERGYDGAEAFLSASSNGGRYAVQVNTVNGTAEELAEELCAAGLPFRSVEGLPGCFELEKGSVTELPGFAEGLFYVQDVAARMAAEVAGAERGMRVLDCCAAPGGKSFASAIRMGNEGEIISCDIHEKKLRLIESGAERLGLGCIRTRCADGSKQIEEFVSAFDLVIADVPCSGLGVLRKKPEIRFKKEEEATHLPEVQSRILENVSSYVRPGGVLLYSTCTVLKAENTEVVRAFLAKHPDFSAEDFEVAGIHSHEGEYTFWPDIDGTDGFYAARLRRNRE